MFNFSFGEIVVITVIAIAVIGPERLPEAARFMGHWLRRIRSQINGARTDILREMELEDMKKIHREFTDAARGAESVFRSAARGVSEEAGRIKAEVMAEDSGSGKKAEAGNVEGDEKLAGR